MNLENPFKLRSSESIESRLLFLDLFGTQILKILDKDHFSNKVTIFRSGPGGGKTSLFRLFGPDPLREISERNNTFTELFKYLSEYKILENNQPQCLGIYLRLHGYETLYNIGLSQDDARRYFFTLIGSRLIMKTLTGILTLKNLEMTDLEKITIKKPDGYCIPGLSLPCNGSELYEWASGMEQNVCEIVDRFITTDETPISLENSMDYIRLINSSNIFFNDKPAVNNFLIMLDDIHELTKIQRKTILKVIISNRFQVPIWIAERLEALELNELISGISGREYNWVDLEDDLGTANRFEKFAKSVSGKRIDRAKLDYDMGELHEHLEEGISNKLEDPPVCKVIAQVKKNVYKIAANKAVYKHWLEDQEKHDRDDYKSALEWRALEILISRKERDGQTRIDESPFPVNRIAIEELTNMADFFIHDKFSIPYFFGFNRICKLSADNMDQFLEISAELFDEILSQQIKNKGTVILGPKRQEEIICSIADRRFEDIRKTNKNGDDIVRFLEGFKDFARRETIRPTASYIPGITGIGILKDVCIKLANGDNPYNGSDYRHLVTTLTTCVSHNYLKVRHDHSHSNKKYTLFYLNRLLCAGFNLPLDKGGWRQKHPEELCKWLNSPPDLSERLKS